VTLVIGAPASRAVLMLHVIFTCLCGVLRGRHPGPGTPGRWTRVGAVPRGTHQLSAQPGPGAMCRAKDVGADVGNNTNHDHIPVHWSHYPERTRKEAR
jgi:hypothetical protein